MHKQSFVGVPFVHTPAITHQGWVKKKEWLSRSNASGLQQKTGDKELITKPATTSLINEQVSFSAQPPNRKISQKDSLPPMVMLTLKCKQSEGAACPTNTSRLGINPRGSTPILSLWESLPALNFKQGFWGDLSANWTANLGSVCSHCMESAPSHSSYGWANKTQKVSGRVCLQLLSYQLK